jgi:hypothetical protein
MSKRGLRVQGVKAFDNFIKDEEQDAVFINVLYFMM